MLRKSLWLVFMFLLIMIIYNLSSLSIPFNQIRYRQFLTYCSETGQQFGLAPYQQNDIGQGMTSTNNEITILKDVQPAFAMLLDEIQRAEHNINIEFFIIRNDESGNQFKNALIEKAQQGLQVRLLYDAWGSALTPNSYFKDLRQNGVLVEAYNPIWSGFWQGRLDNRLHRKIIIIDGKSAYIGGENIGDEYLGKNPKIGFWKDTGISLKGDSVLSIQQVFLNDWLQSTHEKIEEPNFYPLASGIGDKSVNIIPGSPDSRKMNISLPYINLVNSAKSKIYMVSPYFIPNNALLKAVYGAAERNIDIQLILPAKNDDLLARLIQPFYIKNLLSHGIKVYTYNQGFIHSKIMIVDDEAASVGSANFDRLSLSRNYEIISVIYDKELIKQLQNDFLNDLEDSTPLFPANQ